MLVPGRGAIHDSEVFWCPFADQPEGPLQPVNPDRNHEDKDRANKRPKVCHETQLPSILDQICIKDRHTTGSVSQSHAVQVLRHCGAEPPGCAV